MHDEGWLQKQSAELAQIAAGRVCLVKVLQLGFQESCYQRSHAQYIAMLTSLPCHVY
jgi:hypothetical protein